MADFVTIQMHFHARALELFTQCYQTVEAIDTEGDLEEFRTQLRPDGSIRSDVACSASLASLQSGGGSSGPATPRRGRSMPSPKPSPKPAASPGSGSRPTTNGTDGRRKIPLPPPIDLTQTESEEEEDDNEDEEEDSDEYETETETETATISAVKKR